MTHTEPDFACDLPGDLSLESLVSLAAAILPGSHARPRGQFDGGIQSTVHAVDLVVDGRADLQLVVKLFPTAFLAEDPGAFERERRVLHALGSSDIPAPRLVWADTRGELAGPPALVMTRLPGIPLMRVQARQPSSDASWVPTVVRTLARIHRTPVDEEDLAVLPVMDSATLGQELRTMPESEIGHRVASLPWGRDIWAALNRHWDTTITEPRVLVHGDYHAGNLLWHDGDLSGVIDWADARAGAGERDLAHLRWETILRYDLEVLDLVQRTYEDAVGHAMPNTSIWDLLLVWKLGDAIRSWIWFFEIEGRGKVTPGRIEERRRLLIEHALSTIA